MSARASAWVLQLERAPNGEALTSSEVHVLKDLAIRHHQDYGFSWPHLERLARECRLSVRSVQRLINELERKGVLHVGYARTPVRTKDGRRQWGNVYRFVGLDAIPDDAPPRRRAGGRPAARRSAATTSSHRPTGSDDSGGGSDATESSHLADQMTLAPRSDDSGAEMRCHPRRATRWRKESRETKGEGPPRRPLVPGPPAVGRAPLPGEGWSLSLPEDGLTASFAKIDGRLPEVPDVLLAYRSMHDQLTAAGIDGEEFWRRARELRRRNPTWRVVNVRCVFNQGHLVARPPLAPKPASSLAGDIPASNTPARESPPRPEAPSGATPPPREPPEGPAFEAQRAAAARAREGLLQRFPRLGLSPPTRPPRLLALGAG
jgi:hypothetical protein